MKIGSPLPHKKARIEIIPLIDIMFFLLASFMLASLNMIRLQSVKMDLPTARTAKQDFKADLVNVSVGKGGEVYVEKNQVTLVELQKYLDDKVKISTNVPVFISADKDARHGYVTRVLNVVHGCGIQKVSFTISPAASASK
jgi:biopolymer transport protein ExbD